MEDLGDMDHRVLWRVLDAVRAEFPWGLAGDGIGDLWSCLQFLLQKRCVHV